MSPFASPRDEATFAPLSPFPFTSRFHSTSASAMSEPKPSLAARLTATALSLFESTTVAEQQAPETTASRARSASPASTLTSLAPSPYKSRAQPADFRSPLKQGQLPTPSPTSDASTQLLPAPAPLPTRKMPRASLAHSVSAVHDDLKEWLDSGLYYTPPALAEAAGPSSPPPPKPLRQRPPARQASLRRPKDDFDWRKIKQPRSFPMPMYYGVTLLSEERPFKLSFDVLRDGAAFAREGKGVRPLKDEESAWARAEREKLEGSKKPPPYRSIPKSELRPCSDVAPFHADLHLAQTSTLSVDQKSRTIPPSAPVSSLPTPSCWAVARTA